MSDEGVRRPPPTRTARPVTRREVPGSLAACLTVGPAAASRRAALRLATFSADVTPPLGHPLMGDGIAPASEIVDRLDARGFVLLGAGPPVVLAAIDWCEIRNDAFDRWRGALARTGCPWRDLPERFGHWGAVYQRFRRWEKAGRWLALFERSPADLQEVRTIFLDSSVIRAHPHAAGAPPKRGARRPRPSAGAGAGSGPRSMRSPLMSGRPSPSP
jgi:transposase